MKNIKLKLMSIWTSLLLGLISFADATRVSVRTVRPSTGDPDIPNRPSHVMWSRSIFDIISLVNWYLWFTIWLCCFWFMIRNGYQLIMARGDEKQMKSATNALTWCAVGLVVCLLAYIIVNITVKLFR